MHDNLHRTPIDEMEMKVRIDLKEGGKRWRRLTGQSNIVYNRWLEPCKATMLYTNHSFEEGGTKGKKVAGWKGGK
jgi:hypothetical protein